MDGFPPNSMKSKGEAPTPEEKKVEQVAQGAVRRKKSLGKQFRETFIGGDGRTAFRYVVFEVIVPGAKDILADAVNGAVDKIIYGDSRRRGATRPNSGRDGYVQYNQQYRGDRPGSPMAPAGRTLSRQARAQHNFDEILLADRQEAEMVLQGLYDQVSQFGTVSVADLYAMVGFQSNHTDVRWGWTDLHGSGIARTREGWLLDLPSPHPLTK